MQTIRRHANGLHTDITDLHEFTSRLGTHEQYWNSVINAFLSFSFIVAAHVPIYELILQHN